MKRFIVSLLAMYAGLLLIVLILMQVGGCSSIPEVCEGDPDIQECVEVYKEDKREQRRLQKQQQKELARACAQQNMTMVCDAQWPHRPCECVSQETVRREVLQR